MKFKFNGGVVFLFENLATLHVAQPTFLWGLTQGRKDTNLQAEHLAPFPLLSGLGWNSAVGLHFHSKVVSRTVEE